MIIKELSGEKCEFEITDGMKGTHELGQAGIVPLCPDVISRSPTLRLIRKQYTWGQIILEDTGVARHANHGEFILIAGHVGTWDSPYPSRQKYPILRAVELLPCS